MMKTPEQRRFRLDPTFQWAVSVVPITDNSPRFFTRPQPQPGQKYISGSNKPIVRISFRAVIVVDETVFVGVKYDGPDANFLSVIKDNWSVSLKQFPKKFGYFDPDNKQGYKEENMNAILRNGLENEWKVLQSIEQNKKNLCIADADTFIFFEDDDEDQQPNHISLFEIINRVRHLTFTTSMKLEPFPIKNKPYLMPSFQFTNPLNRERDGEVACSGLSEIDGQGRIQIPEYAPSSKYKHMKSIKREYDEQKGRLYNNSSKYCTTTIALVDQPVGTSVISLLLDFKNHRISLHSFVIPALPPSASRLMPVIDDSRVIKTLKGEDIRLFNRVHTGDINVVKSALMKSNILLNQYFSKNITINKEDEIDDSNSY
ncbi:MAG: hypothetical protein EZS28_036424 [Streblomastix strix]|uniref:Uncharacterized protein n=1 Tax=Streblomastix strix TaxID=222440 RepID=A0A5J4UC17_9EUKA|nr:MAG: hypothetical protein EZS28_036424 [Streblomastix strix]